MSVVLASSGDFLQRSCFGGAINRVGTQASLSADYSLFFKIKVTVATPDWMTWVFLADSAASYTDYVWFGARESGTAGVLDVEPGSEGGGSGWVSGGTFALNVGTEYGIGYTRQGSTHKVYVNGTQVSTWTLDMSALTYGESWIGSDGIFANNNRGTFYTRLFREWQGSVLTGAQFVTEAGSTNAVITTNLFTDTPLTDVTDLTDDSGHGHHWAILSQPQVSGGLGILSTSVGNIIDLTSDFTMFGWVKGLTTPPSFNGVFGVVDHSNNGLAAVTRDTSPSLTVATNDGGGSTVTLGATSGSNNVWRPVAVTQSGSTCTFIANGTVIATGTRTFTGLVSRAAYVGWNTSNGGFQVAFHRVWQAALSLSELQAEAQSPTAVRTANLKTDLPLASNALDISANNGYYAPFGTITYAEQPLFPPTSVETVTVSENVSINLLRLTATQPAYVVQSKSLSHSYTVPPPLSFDAPPAVGNLVLVLISGYYVRKAIGVTIGDNRAGGTYPLAAATGLPTENRYNVAAWARVVTASGTPFTVTATMVPLADYDYGSIVIVEIADFNAAAPIAAVFASVLFLNNASPSLPIGVSLNGALLIAALAQSGVTTVTPGTGWTHVQNSDPQWNVGIPLSVTQRDALVTGPYPATWTLSSSAQHQTLALAIAPAVYPPGYVRDKVTVTEAVTLRANPGLRVVFDTVATTESVPYLVPTTTLPLYTEVSDSVAVAETLTPFQRTTPLGSTQHMDLYWGNLPFGTGNSPNWRSGFGYHSGRNINLTVEGSGLTGCPVTVAGRIGNVRIAANNNPGIGATWTFTLFKNAVATDLVVIIGEAGGVGTSGIEVSVVPGDTLAWRCVSVLVGVQFASALLRQTFYGDIPGESIYGVGAYDEINEAVTTHVANALGWDRADTGQWETNGSARAAVVATYGTFTALIIDLYGDSWGPVGTTRTFNLVKNGVVQDGTGGTANTTLTFPVTSSAFIAETRRASATFAIAAVPGDYLFLQCVQAYAGTIGSSTRVYVKWGVKFVAERAGESLTGFIPWDTLSVGTGASEQTTTFRDGQGWNTAALATRYAQPWTLRRLWVWASKARAAGVLMTPKQNSTLLTALQANVSAAGVSQITAGDILMALTTDTIGCRAQSAAGVSETGPRYSFGFTQYVGDPGNFLWDTVAVTDAVFPAMSIAYIDVGDTTLVSEADTEDETIAVLEGGDIAQQRRDVVTVAETVRVIAGVVGFTLVDTVVVTEAVIFPAPDLNLYRVVHDLVSVLDTLSAPQAGDLLVRSTETITVSDLLRTRTPLLAVNLSELVAVTEGPMNLSAAGIGIAPTPPPGSTLQDYWVVGIV